MRNHTTQLFYHPIILVVLACVSLASAQTTRPSIDAVLAEIERDMAGRIDAERTARTAADSAADERINAATTRAAAAEEKVNQLADRVDQLEAEARAPFVTVHDIPKLRPGTYRVRAGVYHVSSAVHVPARVKLVADGEVSIVPAGKVDIDDIVGNRNLFEMDAASGLKGFKIGGNPDINNRTGISPRGHSVEIVDCTFTHLETAYSDNTGLAGCVFSRNVVSDMRGLGVWNEGVNTTVTDNVITRIGQHCIRFESRRGQGGLIARNKLSEYQRGAVVIRAWNASPAAQTDPKWALIIEDNEILANTQNPGGIGFAPEFRDPAAMTFNAIARRNKITGAGFEVDPGASGIIIEENEIIFPRSDDTPGIMVSLSKDAFGSREARDVIIRNNRMTNEGTEGAFLAIFGKAKTPKTITFTGNTYIAPKMVPDWWHTSINCAYISDPKCLKAFGGNQWSVKPGHPPRFRIDPAPEDGKLRLIDVWNATTGANPPDVAK